MSHTPADLAPSTLPLLDVATIYHEPGVLAHPRGRAILARFPDAERIAVPSHWNIPALHRDAANAEGWVRVKRGTLVLGTKKTLTVEPNTRSSDFIAPSHSNGCAMSCAYCVAEGTRIATPDGDKPVEQVAEGDTVLAYDLDRNRRVAAKVGAVAWRTVTSTLALHVGDAILNVTAEHPIRTLDGWADAGTLRVGDPVLCDGPTPTPRMIRAIRKVAGPTQVVNFHVPTYENYIANGVVTHNCYVARRKGFANPVSTFVNIDGIMRAIHRHAARQGEKRLPTPADPHLWIYEIGNNSDVSVDALISDNVRDLVTLFRQLPFAKATYATKFFNPAMLNYDPQRKTRVRFSLMPQRMATLVDVRTSRISERIAAMNEFHRAGYEVNVNFAPVVWTDTWQQDYAELFAEIDDVLAPAVKAQLVAEIIFLVHNDALHAVNMAWHPKGEAVLWRPDLQETKSSENGQRNVRYKRGLKSALVRDFTALLAVHLPFVRVRYAF